MIVGCKKACRQIFGDFRPVSICVGKPAKKPNFFLMFFTVFLWKRAQEMGIGKQNNSKCIQEEGFGIFGTTDEKSQFCKGKNLYIYILYIYYIYIYYIYIIYIYYIYMSPDPGSQRPPHGMVPPPIPHTFCARHCSETYISIFLHARRCSETHIFILLDEPSRRIRWVDSAKLWRNANFKLQELLRAVYRTFQCSANGIIYIYIYIYISIYIHIHKHI